MEHLGDAWEVALVRAEYLDDARSGLDGIGSKHSCIGGGATPLLECTSYTCQPPYGRSGSSVASPPPLAKNHGVAPNPPLTPATHLLTGQRLGREEESDEDLIILN